MTSECEDTGIVYDEVGHAFTGERQVALLRQHIGTRGLQYLHSGLRRGAPVAQARKFCGSISASGSLAIKLASIQASNYGLRACAPREYRRCLEQERMQQTDPESPTEQLPKPEANPWKSRRCAPRLNRG